MTTFPPDRAPDWQDRHEGMVAADITTARQAYEQSFRSLPPWVGWALNLRNRLVSIFGLKTTAEGGTELMLGLPIISERPDSYEIGLEDRHLTFTLLTEKTEGKASVTTRIWFNHWAGRLYLAVVLIPHKIIVKRALGGWHEQSHAA